MRVIAGRWGGRRLQAPPGRSTRPTSDRVREALFSVLGDRVVGARVLDLFAGSGALGLEALGLGPAEAEVRHAEALVALQSARRRSEKYDLVFIDPPYDRAQGLEPRLAELLPPLLGPGARVVVESDRRAPLRLALPLQRERVYGDTAIRIHRSNEPT